MDIGDRLKTLRGDLSQEEFAHRIGFNKNTIGNYERGDRTPDVVFMKAVCENMNVSPEWLLWGEGTMNRGEGASTEPQALAPAPAQPTEEDWKMSDMLTKTAEVLESGTIYRTALASNINAFHQAVRSERTLAHLEDRVSQLEMRMEELADENAKLKRRLEQREETTAKAVGEAV
jgi:transcriptional regulator with XRE-family HTH domain